MEFLHAVTKEGTHKKMEMQIW